MKLKLLSLGIAAVLLPAVASAQQAMTTTWVNLRAGPTPEMPQIASLAPNTPLTIQGCVDGFSWCDVVTPVGARGWIYAGYISYPYQGSSVTVLSAGPTIGIPIVAFALGAYWGSYYKSYPWYGNQNHYHYYARPPGYYPPGGYRPPGYRPPPPHGGGYHPPPGYRPPHGGKPPGQGGRPPSGGKPPGAGGPPPGGGGGGSPPGAGGGRPPGGGGGPPPGGGGKPPGGGAGGKPPGGGPPGGGGRPGLQR